MKLATLCYVRHDDTTLMLFRNKKKDDIHEGKWNGLGGKFAPGETPEECVVREVREESGLTIKNPELKGLLTFPKFRKGEDWYVFVFRARVFSGELIDSPEGRLAWIPNAKVLDLNLWEGDKYFFPWLDKNLFFSASFVYVDGRLKDYQVSFHG